MAGAKMELKAKMAVPEIKIKLSVNEFAERFRNESISLGHTFSYYCAIPPLTEMESREYLNEPIAALPPAVAEALPKILVLLVPYLEKKNGKPAEGRSDLIAMERPADAKLVWSSAWDTKKGHVMAFGVKEQEMAEYHYHLFQGISVLMSGLASKEVLAGFSAMLRDEMNAEVHGEVDESSWRLKQTLRRSKTGVRRETKAFRIYARQSFIDTLTLFLHGICCDIDVETGPRQLASRHMRKRLELLRGFYPPPKGYAVFPEDLKV